MMFFFKKFGRAGDAQGQKHVIYLIAFAHVRFMGVDPHALLRLTDWQRTQAQL